MDLRHFEGILEFFLVSLLCIYRFHIHKSLLNCVQANKLRKMGTRAGVGVSSCSNFIRGTVRMLEGTPTENGSVIIGALACLLVMKNLELLNFIITEKTALGSNSSIYPNKTWFMMAFFSFP